MEKVLETHNLYDKCKNKIIKLNKKRIHLCSSNKKQKSRRIVCPLWKIILQSFRNDELSLLNNWLKSELLKDLEEVLVSIESSIQYFQMPQINLFANMLAII